jgi:plasmid stability protein
MILHGEKMKAITIRGVDNNLEKKLKVAAKSGSLSVNQLILNSLRKSLGLEKDKIHTREYTDLNFLFGKWTEEEYEAFEKTQKDFQSIDAELWK